MITGANTDVEYDGRRYHVQTEDKGPDNPTVESLIYCQGEILGTRRLPYPDRLLEALDEDEVARLVEKQHSRLLREVRNGLWSPEGPKLVGADVITERSFDRVVAEFLAGDPELERVAVAPVQGSALRAGEDATLRLRTVLEGDPPPPAAGVHLTARLVAPGRPPVLLVEGESDAEGLFEAEVSLRFSGPGPASVIVACGTAGGSVLRLPVEAAARRPERGGPRSS